MGYLIYAKYTNIIAIDSGEGERKIEHAMRCEVANISIISIEWWKRVFQSVSGLTSVTSGMGHPSPDGAGGLHKIVFNISLFNLFFFHQFLTSIDNFFEYKCLNGILGTIESVWSVCKLNSFVRAGKRFFFISYLSFLHAFVRKEVNPLCKIIFSASFVRIPTVIKILEWNLVSLIQTFH